MLGAHIQVAVEQVTGAHGLIGAEQQAVSKAVAKRQAEFAAGRRAARAALGNPDADVPAGKDRAPIWPTGFVGSITHDESYAIAICAPSDATAGLGVDLAEAATFPDHLRPRVLTSPLEQDLSGLDARVVFSAKETLFKALYPQVQHFFGFEAASVLPDINAHCFTATLTTDLADYQRGMVFCGGLKIVEDKLLTTLVLPA